MSLDGNAVRYQVSTMSQSKKPKADKPTRDYPVQTGLEANAMMCAVSDGKSGRFWTTNDGPENRVHQIPGAAHRVQMVLTDGERELGFTTDILQKSTEQCDADDVFTLLYISRQIAPKDLLPPGALSGEVISIDEVIKAIGWYPQNTLERAEMRRRVWQFIKFVARAHIIGQRRYKHRDTMTGEEVDTYIDSPPWLIGEQVKEGDPQLPLFESDDDMPPLSVHIAATPMWTRLTATPETAQFLPLGEVLGAIPGGKPAGAWARVIGLALTNFWRRNPREAMSGKIKPTRRELLEHYTPATGPVSELMNSARPTRAIEYWAGALRILTACEFLENSGEAALTYDQMRDALPLRIWQEDWLNGEVEFHPGRLMLESVQDRAQALPQKKPRYRKKR